MSNKAASIALGAKAAEVANAKKQVELMKSKEDALQKRIQASAKKIKAAFARYGFAVSDTPTPEEIENGLACMEAFNVRTQQLADQMVASLGFTPESERNRDAE